MTFEGKRSFYQVLVNTFIATLTTSFLWFALVFWVYLETRSVLATSLLGGSYMLGLAAMGVPFGVGQMLAAAVLRRSGGVEVDDVHA